MRCLWLTREVPYPPRYGGDVLYTSHLIEGLAAAGAEVTVVCGDNGGPPPETVCHQPGVTWDVVPTAREPARWRSLLGPLPSIAYRYISRAMRERLVAHLAAGHWDAVIVDYIGMAWTLSELGAAGDGGPVVVYVSHNHEESVRRAVAAQVAGPLRLAHRLDAAKVAPLERRLVRRAGLVVANTSEDAALYRRDIPVQRYVVVTPGYEGPVFEARDPVTLPRRATLVGSFAWIAKQANLLALLEVAMPRFRASRAELEVVGSMPPRFAMQLRARYPDLQLSLDLEDLTPRLRDARIGLVAEQLGGGFKHKVLQYIFGRLPVAALRGSVAGTPLVPGESMIEEDDLPSLVDSVLRAIDDPDRLRRLDAAAFEACRGRFDWAERGRTLFAALEAAIGARTGVAGDPSRP